MINYYLGIIFEVYIAIAIAAVIGILFAWAGANFKRGIQTQKWIEVEGKVISSRVEQTGTTIEFDHPTYESFATVEYVVNGQTYRTSEVNDFIGTVSAIGKPKAIPKSSMITVYYDPHNPGDAVLNRSAFRLSVFLGIIGVGFIALEWHWVTMTFF